VVKKNIRYVGLLNKPISPDAVTGILNSDAKSKTDYINREQWRRIEALFELFKIEGRDPASWALLATELALRHVPGMKVSAARRVGRPTRWDANSMKKLVSAVDELQSRSRIKISVETAVKQIRKVESTLKDATAKQYYESKKELLKYEKTSAEWERMLSRLQK